MENILRELLVSYGTWNNEGKKYFFDAEYNGIYVAWPYWNDNGDTHYDDDAYTKKMTAITKDDDGNIIIVWDKKFKEAFSSLDENCQDYILEQVTEWFEDEEEYSECENFRERFQE